MTAPWFSHATPAKSAGVNLTCNEYHSKYNGVTPQCIVTHARPSRSQTTHMDVKIHRSSTCTQASHNRFNACSTSAAFAICSFVHLHIQTTNEEIRLPVTCQIFYRQHEYCACVVSLPLDLNAANQRLRMRVQLLQMLNLQQLNVCMQSLQSLERACMLVLLLIPVNKPRQNVHFLFRLSVDGSTHQ